MQLIAKDSRKIIAHNRLEHLIHQTMNSLGFWIFALINYSTIMQFSHLHNHTEYSLLDGFSRIDKLYNKALKENMPALAITDHGNMFGVFRFVVEAYKHKKADGTPKVKPIIGCEFYLVKNRHQQSFSKEQKDKRYHQILIAKNDQGYQNLSQLCSLGYIEGLYGRYPRIDKELIVKYKQGLIATSCCIGAIIPQLILAGELRQAEDELKWWLEQFGEDFYIELQNHKMPEQLQINAELQKFATKYQVKMIATNDAHYVEQDEASLHEILLCINTGAKLSMPTNKSSLSENLEQSSTRSTRFAFPNNEFYLKSQAEMQALFPDLPEALDNTQEIVDKVECLNLSKAIILPRFNLPAEFHSQDSYLRHLTQVGAKDRYNPLTSEIQERIDFELRIIETMGFAGYFLIVADLIKTAKMRGVRVGPGRGSAAGSVIAYCLGITNIDPIKYNLLFERFLNPDRKSMPDIDTDFDDENRDKVIEYACEKYGQAQVAQIITYNTMAAKASIQDVARVYDIARKDAEKLSKLVPSRPYANLQKILDQSENELSEVYSANEMQSVRKLRDIYHNKKSKEQLGTTDAPEILGKAKRIEGTVRNISTHAAGILIAPEPLTKIIPLCKVKDSPMLVSQIEGTDIEDAGVLKMDILGLKNLSIISKTLALIKQRHGLELDIDNIPLDDPKTFQLYQDADTVNTFQFESDGMRKYLKELKPDTFEDLIAMNALYRPGPMDYIPSFIRRKHKKEPVSYDLPEMEPYLKETYGITVYQEQVMLLAQRLANFSKGDADLLRKAMGKKNKSVLDKLQNSFLENGQKNGHSLTILQKIWSDWEAFASYAFNKSHSTCYSFLAYQTAYLKAHYRIEYNAALLDCAGSTEKITKILTDLGSSQITILGPDINESMTGFSVNNKGQIRYGFSHIKGVGSEFARNIVQEREQNGYFSSIFDLVERLSEKDMKKGYFEALVYSGAFDNLDPKIPRFLYVQPYCKSPKQKIDDKTPLNTQRILTYAKQYHNRQENNTPSLFGTTNKLGIAKPDLGHYLPVSLYEILSKEWEYTGYFLSGHPLDEYTFERQSLKHQPIQTLIGGINNKTKNQMNNNVYSVMGIITSVDHRITKAGNGYANFIIQDSQGTQLKLSLFREQYNTYKGLLTLFSCLFLQIRHKNYGNEEELAQITQLYSLDALPVSQISLYLSPQQLGQPQFNFLKDNLARFPGISTLSLNFCEGQNHLQLTKAKALNLNREFKQWVVNNKYQCELTLNL